MGGANLNPFGDGKGIQDTHAEAKKARKKDAIPAPPPPVDEVAPILREISRAKTDQELRKRSGRYGSFMSGTPPVR